MEPWEEIPIPKIEEKPHKNRGAAAAILGVCMLAVAITVVFIFRMYYAEERKLIRGFQNLAREVREQQELWNQAVGEAAEARADAAAAIDAEAGTSADAETAAETGALMIETRLNLSGEGFPVTLGVDTVLLRDAAARKMKADTILSVMNHKLAKVQVYGEEDTLMIGLPDFFKQKLVFDAGRIDRQYNHSFFAEKFGEAEMPEISLQLFPKQERSLENALAVWEKFLEDWKETRKSGESLPTIQVERLQKDVEIRIDESSGATYRCSQYLVTIPKEWIERLAADRENVRLEQDAAFLVAMDRNSHIICLSLEEPLSFLVETAEGESTVEVDADVSFLGKKRSMDDLIAGIELDVPLELLTGMSGFGKSLLPYERELAARENRSKSAARENRIKIKMNTEIVFEENNMRIVMEPNQLTVSMNQGREFKVTGSVALEPLREEIQPLEGEPLRIFEVTEAEYQDLEEQLQRKIRKWEAAYGKNFWQR